MTAAVAIRPLAGAPDALSVALGQELRRAARMLELEGKVDLKAGAREALVSRKADIDYALRPIDRDALDRILMSLETMMAQATPGHDGELRLRLARHDLAPLPEFALKAAAEDFRRGLAGDAKFRPTIAELSRLARLKAQRFRDEAHQIGRVLSAGQVDRTDPIEAAKVRDGFGELARTMAEAAACDPHPRPLSQTGERGSLDEVLDGVKLSDAAAGALRLSAGRADRLRAGEDGL
jgi:hypothetical protein